MGRFFRPLFRRDRPQLEDVSDGRALWSRLRYGHRGGPAGDRGHARPGKGIPIASMLVFPALFTAGMTLMDTTDSILMLGAYGWAFVKPIRKLYYNMNIT